MKTFAYVAADLGGASQRGEVDAESHTAALAHLTAQGLFPIRLRVRRRRFAEAPVTRRQLAALFGSMASLTKAGLPLVESLRVSEGVVSKKLARRLGRARELLGEGQPLSLALRSSGIAIPSVGLGMLQAAEGASQLEAGLRRVATAFEQDADLVSRARQALAYPAVLAVVGIFSIGMIVGVVVPRFAAMLADFGQTPPLTTRLVLALGQAVRRYGLVMVVIASLGIVGVRHLLRQPSLRRRTQALLLQWPGLGQFLHQAHAARYSSMLGEMLNAGIPLVTALRICVAGRNDDVIAERLGRASDRIQRGEALASALTTERAFTDDVHRLVRLGEANGRLGDMLSQAGSLAAIDVERRLRIVVSLLEPAMILTFASLIGIVAAALLQAVYALRPEAAL